MADELQYITNNIEQKILDTRNISDLESLRVEVLGKKGTLTRLLKSISKLDKKARSNFGAKINNAKSVISELIIKQKKHLEILAIEQQIRQEKLDITLPTRARNKGSVHPVFLVLKEIETIFKNRGFDIVFGPEIENDFYNFAALNIPKHHPARAMHDTFYFANGNVLRTHTSPVQIRTMQKCKPPIYTISSGKVYRHDLDLTHTPMFHQIEGLIIDKKLSFAQLKGLLIEFLQLYFDNSNLNVRFRASYFPFTEPSAELDIECVRCFGKGCRVCSYTGYLEVLGCGVVHPNVLKASGVDSDWSGLAFGMGIERLTMLKYDISDLRLFFDNDLRFLEQFS